MTTPTDESLESLAAALGEALEARGVEYALSGALAFAYWGVPRATKDIDVALYCTRSAADAVADAVESVGATVDRASLRGRFGDGGMECAWRGLVRIDLFTPSIEFEGEALRTRVRTTLGGRPVWIVSAEALCVFKLLFFRSKDIPDLERIVAIQGDRLEAAYVRSWITQMMGEEDERVRKWDEIVREFRPGPGGA
jgi:hypothetical protein